MGRSTLEKIQASPDVLECHHITGAWNYILKVRVGTTRDLETFLAKTVKAVEGVLRTETIIVLSSAKETRGLERLMALNACRRSRRRPCAHPIRR